MSDYQKIQYIRTLPIITMVPAAVTPSTYLGPGDVVSGAVSWYGLRAYSRATIGSNAIRLRRTSDNSEQDFATTGNSNGGVSIAAINTFAGGSTNLYVVTLYDQISSNNVTQSVSSNQLLFYSTGFSATLPAILGTSNAEWITRANSIGQSQPLTISSVEKRTGNFTTQSDVLSWNGIETTFAGTSNTVGMARAGGATVTAAASDTSWHAVNSIFSTAADGGIDVDGTRTTGSVVSTAGIVSGGDLIIAAGDTVGNNPLVGYFSEVGMWPTGFSTSQGSSMSANQHNYWGF